MHEAQFAVASSRRRSQRQLRRFSRCCARLRATLNRLPGIFGIWGGNLFVSRRCSPLSPLARCWLFLFIYFIFVLLFLFSFVVFRFLLDAIHFGHFPLAAFVVLCFATICSLLFYLAILKIYNKSEHLKMNYLVGSFCSASFLLFFLGCNCSRQTLQQ